MQLYLIFSFSAIALICGASALPRDISAAVVPNPYYNQPAQNDANSRDRNAQILSYSNQFNPEDNSFVFQYEADNGMKSEGFAKDNKVSIRGSYFMLLPDGSQVPVHYTADAENGFQVDSPAIPTPHPSIAKAAAYLRTLPPLREDEEEAKKSEIYE